MEAKMQGWEMRSEPEMGGLKNFTAGKQSVLLTILSTLNIITITCLCHGFLFYSLL
jgi:hypothetical protein